MPRAKVPGAPPPKPRSRKGCWPCKERKVKCDEENRDVPGGFGPCKACQRLNQQCDFRMRLNWDGRGRKDQPGVINFSSNSISVGIGPAPAAPAAPAPASTPSPPGGEMLMPASLQSSPVARPLQRPSSSTSNQASFGSPSTPPMIYPYPLKSPTSSIPVDPSLGRFQLPTFHDSPDIFNLSQRSTQYTQSFERYQHTGGSTPESGPLGPTSRFRHRNDPEDSFSAFDSGAPSPAASNQSGLSFTFSGTGENSGSSLLKYPGRNERDELEYTSAARPSKKRRLGARDIDSSHDRSMPPPDIGISYTYQNELAPSSYTDGFVGLASNPPTPKSSSGDDAIPRTSSSSAQRSPNIRKLSVNSLLSGPPGMSSQNYHNTPRSNPDANQDLYLDLISYGVDRGIKDLDFPRNDDDSALTGSSPITKRAHLALVRSASDQREFGLNMGESNLAFEPGGYYHNPVDVALPRSLHPIPLKLLRNPMNILYFHHFLNHTAKCLLPHNCASNPFRMILPLMAVEDDNLMNLFLAYSAFHRSRMLDQPEPKTRIALWVQDVFANLRKAIDDPTRIITNSTLAAAIMLASLEIISPNAFGVTVPWQSHLDMARQMIVLRGGPKGMRVQGRNDEVSSFLWSWFAYLDVLGSLSGGRNSPTSTWVLDYHVEADTDYEIDCVLGFTSKCIRILAKIAALAQKCDRQRIQPIVGDALEWTPSEDLRAQAAQLEAELIDSRLAPSTPCTHMQASGEAAYQWDNVEMAATNEAFHWAGHVHLQRRILGKPSAHPNVQSAVRATFGALCKVRKGSNAEGCLLFPMFTAGCDTQDEKQRADILERMKSAQRLGMSQVHRARTLMERVWETGKPWETLVAGEFFG